MTGFRPRLLEIAALVPVMLSILWLPLRAGGADQFPLLAVQGLTFLALAAAAVTGRIVLRGPRAFWLLLGLALVGAVLSTVFSKDLDASVPELIEWLWLGALALLISSFAAEDPPRKLVLGSLAAAVIIQSFWGSFVWWGGGDPADTQSGTFYSPNQYAGFLLLLAPLLIASALLVKPRREAAAWGGVAAFVCLGVILSGSRGGMVALGIGTISTIVLAARVSWKKTLVRSLVLLGSAVLMGLLLTSPLVLSDRTIEAPNKGPLENVVIKGSPSPSLGMRLRWVEGAIRIGTRYPFTGAGLGTYGDMLVQVQEPSWHWSRYAHNHYAEGFAEGGILLALGVIAIPATAVLSGSPFARRPRSPLEVQIIGIIGALLGGAAHLVIDHDWSFPAYGAAFMVLAAIAVTRSDPERNLSTRRIRLPAAIVLGALSLTLLAAVVSRGLALDYMNGPETDSVGQTVTLLAPYSAQAHHRHARELIRSGDLEGASRAIETAISMDKLEPRLRWQAAEIYVRFDRLPDAERSYLQAIRIAPNAPASYRNAAEFFLTIGEPAKAMEILDQGLARLSEHPLRDRLVEPIEALGSLRSEAATRLRDPSRRSKFSGRESYPQMAFGLRILGPSPCTKESRIG